MEGAADLGGQIAQLGKGLVQVNLRLSRLSEALERGGERGAGGGASLEALLDLLEAVDLALERRRPARGPLALLARRAARREQDLWRGLALARDAALERLAREGLAPAPREGALDPLVHRVVEVVPARRGRPQGTLAATHRRGWVRIGGGEREVVRTAQVSVYGDGNDGGGRDGDGGGGGDRAGGGDGGRET